MIGDVISLGTGSPASIATFILVGLSANPEVRDAEILAVIGLYDAALAMEGWYDPTLTPVGLYDATLTVTGE